MLYLVMARSIRMAGSTQRSLAQRSLARRSLAWALAAAAASSFLAVGLTACGGGGSSSSDDVIARVGETAITRTAVSHWMGALAGGDYYVMSSQHTVPAGLVSDPPDYAGCVASLEAAAKSSPTKASRPTGTQLLTKCQQLYKALKLEATEFLIKMEQLIGMAHERGVTVTDGEIQQSLKQSKAEYPSETKFREYLASQRRNISDELFLLKRNLLSQKVGEKISEEGKQALAKLTKTAQKWNAKTNCNTGYVVQHCKQYTNETNPTPPPSILMEQVTQIATGRCVNLPACSKQ